VSTADEPVPDEETRESLVPLRTRGVLSQSLAEELLVVAVFACFAMWLLWGL
jgi:hypothetical protein